MRKKQATDHAFSKQQALTDNKMSTKRSPVIQDKLDDCWNRSGAWGNENDRCPKLAQAIHCRNCSVYSLAGGQLLNRPFPAEYQQERTKILAEKKLREHANTKSAFVFRTGTDWFALPASLVREVVKIGKIHTIPHLSNNVLRGLVNIKGKLEICVSIGAVLGIERLKNTESQTRYVSPERLVVIVRVGQVITFPVTEVVGIVRYHPEMMRGLPVTVSGSKAIYTKGILCHDDKDIGFLDEKQLFQTLTKDLS